MSTKRRRVRRVTNEIDAVGDTYPVVEKTIAELRTALENSETTSVALVQSYLRRINTYDQNGIRLNSVVELNPHALREAEESDRRRVAGKSRGLLEGIPFTAKDSYMVKGTTVQSALHAAVCHRRHVRETKKHATCVAQHRN